MKYRKLITPFFSSMGMFLLILDGKAAIAGARDGIELCLHTLIPSLFPFILLSLLLTNALSGFRLKLIRPIGKFCRIPLNSEFLLLLSFLGGYPVGAQMITQLYTQGQIKKDTADRLLTFCNNAGPSFLFGVTSFLFTSQTFSWILWLIHILSALLVSKCFPAQGSSMILPKKQMHLSVSNAMKISIVTMASICGWVIFARIFISMLYKWVLWILPKPIQILVVGLLELSNGCILLQQIPNEGLRFMLCSIFLAQGGLCVALQTASVIQDLSLQKYLYGKLFHTLFSTILSATAALILFPTAQQKSILIIFPFLSLGCLLFLLTCTHFKKMSRNKKTVSV